MRQTGAMPCLIALLAIPLPRLAIILVVIFSDYIGTAYTTVLWPLLVFFFMPVPTLSYAWDIPSGAALAGVPPVVGVLALLVEPRGLHGVGLRSEGGVRALRRPGASDDPAAGSG